MVGRAKAAALIQGHEETRPLGTSTPSLQTCLRELAHRNRLFTWTREGEPDIFCDGIFEFKMRQVRALSGAGHFGHGEGHAGLRVRAHERVRLQVVDHLNQLSLSLPSLSFEGPVAQVTTIVDTRGT